MITTGYPDGLLDALSNMSIRESYVKIELLDWNENFIQEIQGVVTTGSFSFDGKSSMRRTCNFTMVIPDGQDEYELARIINLNKKFRLYIGYKKKSNYLFKKSKNIQTFSKFYFTIIVIMF